MAGHDDEAPRVADLLRALEQASPPRRRPGWYVPFMVAAAVAAVVAGSVWAGGLLGGHKQAPVSGGAIPVQRLLSCPASYAHQAPWVPAKPAGIDGRSEGPPVLVSILIGCHPAVDNDDLQANSASSVMPVVRQLLKPA